MPPFGGTAAGREQYGVKISKMCGKDVLSYGKDVILAKKEQGRQESKAGTTEQNRNDLAMFF